MGSTVNTMSEHDMHLLDSAPFGRILPAMVTPMKSDGSVDFAAAQKLAKYLVADGADGVGRRLDGQRVKGLLRGGERLDTLREPLRGGGVGASEQFARRGVEHGDVSGDVARAAPGQMHGLV